VVTSVAALLLSSSSAAHAYRPFDGTDADVAEQGAFELEIGPVQYVHTPDEALLDAPVLVANFGFARGWELVLEGRGSLLVHRHAGDRHWLRVRDTALNTKAILRWGSLQGRTGPSIATEVGLLLPELHDEPGVGAQAALIVSHRVPAATVHANLAVARTRAARGAGIGSLIVEGPIAWQVRPVAELLVAHELAGTTEISGLAGAIWHVRDRFSVDLGFRGARVDGEPVYEARLGFTVGFTAWKLE
jgi:hypothetical protein